MTALFKVTVDGKPVGYVIGLANQTWQAQQSRMWNIWSARYELGPVVQYQPIAYCSSLKELTQLGQRLLNPQAATLPVIANGANPATLG